MRWFFGGMRRQIICAAVIFAVIACGSYAGFLAATNNFHVVIADQVYRSAQPSAAEIVAYKAKYGIRTIVNLRGANPQDSWYQNERAAAQGEGIIHIDFGMSARQVQSPEKMRRLIKILAAAPKPLLIHCQSGADRTGLASALYLAAIAKTDEASAQAQLSIRYGHFSVPVLSQAYPMDQSFENIEGLFGDSDTAWELPSEQPSNTNNRMVGG
ncbi:dual specificity protein phosphatase family protein (plasmid) [Rhizobium sp. CB3171]|uniref:dual specificity protein phosphatase family protein n=1 Tax=Rhizobium sp. CB3171 TaxID=3039157 RepID=UPI0024B0F2B2|nr:dual specificity protein phosphatase family protein [Rhizobium sp. CB3171]WFU05704.1 dual specificity protein phosphatase family protein [Rhizobium sp. CB3171]